MTQMEADKLLTIITHTVEKHGCRIVDIDLENHLINIEGPEQAQEQCAIALGEILN